jgi:hypothetical protein
MPMPIKQKTIKLVMANRHTIEVPRKRSASMLTVSARRTGR